MLISGIAFLLVAVIEVILLLRFLERHPGDLPGIWLSFIAVTLFLLAAFISLRGWRKGTAAKE